MIKNFYIFILLGIFLSACSNQYTGLGFPYSNQDKSKKIESIEIPEEGQDVIKATEEILSASVEKIPTITAIGYAVVSTQPGKNVAQKRLMAIRAARMAAMTTNIFRPRSLLAACFAFCSSSSLMPSVFKGSALWVTKRKNFLALSTMALRVSVSAAKKPPPKPPIN